MAKSKENSQKSQAETSVKRLIRKLRRKGKDKSPTVEPKNPVEAPKPVVTPPAVGASRRGKRGVNSRRRRPSRTRRVEEEGEAAERSSLPPRPSWFLHSSRWSPEALAVAEEFLGRYAEMGYKGIREEFEKEIQDYKSPEYADTFWKANPTKNRDKDHMTCLDETRVEFVADKKKYINASWLYDTQLVAQKYILTQEPIVPLAKGDDSTLEEFWQMIMWKECAIVINFYKWERKRHDANSKGIYREIMGDDFYPTARYNGKPVEISDVVLEIQTHPKSEELRNRHTFMKISPKVCHMKHEHTKQECFSRETRIFEENESFDAKWPMQKIFRLLFTIAQIDEAKGRTIVLMDEFSGTSKAAVFVAIDVLGNLLWTAQKDVTLASIVKWIRRCRNGAIRNADEYLFIFKVLVRKICSFPSLKKTEKLAAMYQGMLNDEEEKRKKEEYDAWIREMEDRAAG